MLNLKRREGESIVIAHGAIVVTVLEIHGTWVKLGWEASREIPIHRAERQAEIEAKAAPPKCENCGRPKTPKGQKTAPLYFVRATSLAEAVAHVKTDRPDGKAMAVKPWFEELPRGVMVCQAKPAAKAKEA